MKQKRFKICLLSNKFYAKFSSKEFPEILQKGDKRPYLVLLIFIDDKQYAIPFRSNINHKYCFQIFNERGNNEGLDNTKAVIVENDDIGRPAHVRANSIPQIDENFEIILRDFKNYLMLLDKIIKNYDKTKSSKLIYEMSALKYFINIK